MKTVALLLVLATTYSYSDDVYLKNGWVYRNVTVLDMSQDSLRIQFGPSIKSVPISNVENILRLALLPNAEPVFVDESRKAPDINLSQNSTYYPNMKLLPVVILASGIAWNSLATASDAQNSIDINNKFAAILKTQTDNSGLERVKSRNEIVGYISIFTAIATLVVCFSDSQVEVSDNKLSMRFSF